MQPVFVGLMSHYDILYFIMVTELADIYLLLVKSQENDVDVILSVVKASW